MPAEIRLARGLTLPLEAVTQKFAILGNPEMGKSTAATTLTEQVYRLGVPVVVLDVKGDWWGIRSSRDGKSPGLEFVVFGGEHADVPLEPTAGALIADTIIDYQISAILDLSMMSKTKQRTFATAFAERLYHRNRDPLHVVVDEADVLIPQRADAATARLIGAMEDIGKRGRGRGIGLTIASQRGQEVHKSVLDIMGNLILLGMTGRLNIKVISDWISVNAANDEISAAEVIGSLPSLQRGEAWFWSPSFMRTVQKVKINLFTTFDSKATPKPGQKRIVPARRAEIDLAKLGEEIAATVERTKAADPTALRNRVAELERQLATARAQLDAAANQAAAQVDEIAHLRAEVEAAAATARPIALPSAILDGLAEVSAALEAGLSGVHTVSKLIGEHNDTATSAPVRPPAPRPAPTAAVRPAPPRPAAAPPAAPKSAGVGPGEKLPKAQRAVLAALAPYYPNSRTKRQVAMLAGYAGNGGGFNNAISALRTAGYIEGTGAAMAATEAGLAALGEYTPLPTGEALQQHWLNSSHLGKAPRLVLEALIQVWPGTLSKVEVAERTGYEPGGGGFNNAISRLRTLELITGDGNALRADDDLMQQ